jgi:hypothetical protein
MIISELVWAARRGSRARSGRALSSKLGLSPYATRNWMNGTSLPSDDNMVKLCAMAGWEPLPWLLWLNMQRAEGPAIAIYSDLANKLGMDLGEAQAA